MSQPKWHTYPWRDCNHSAKAKSVHTGFLLAAGQKLGERAARKDRQARLDSAGLIAQKNGYRFEYGRLRLSDGKPERSENCFVKLPQTKKASKGLPSRLLFEIPAMTYSPTKFPWQYHRR
jgi:hypothetical protein